MSSSHSCVNRVLDYRHTLRIERCAICNFDSCKTLFCLGVEESTIIRNNLTGILGKVLWGLLGDSVLYTCKTSIRFHGKKSGSCRLIVETLCRKSRFVVPRKGETSLKLILLSQENGGDDIYRLFYNKFYNLK